MKIIKTAKFYSGKQLATKRVLEKKNPSRPHICWGSLFCTNLTQPTGNLDSKTGDEVIALLKMTAKKYGQTIVMITHDDEIAQVADHILVIEDGQVVDFR